MDRREAWSCYTVGLGWASCLLHVFGVDWKVGLGLVSAGFRVGRGFCAPTFYCRCCNLIHGRGLCFGLEKRDGTRHFCVRFDTGVTQFILRLGWGDAMPSPLTKI